MSKQSGKIPQSAAELHTHVKEQVDFLRVSTSAYDHGNEAEAKRLALAIRVLVHDSGNSRSLLQTLDVKQTLNFWSFWDPSIAQGKTIFCALGMSLDKGGMRYVPAGGMPVCRLKFDDWWNRVALYNKVEGVEFTCKDAVLGVANKDGGAHVDPSLDEAYAKVSRYNQFGWKAFAQGTQIPIANGPHLPLIQQTAKELERTLTEHFGF
jgi:hypothetical protein